jgi:hypothetical protein
LPDIRQAISLDILEAFWYFNPYVEGYGQQTQGNYGDI